MVSLQHFVVAITACVVTIGYLVILGVLVQRLIKSRGGISTIRTLMAIAVLIGTLPPILSALAGLGG